jgi:Outer membrane efflux protein
MCAFGWVGGSLGGSLGLRQPFVRSGGCTGVRVRVVGGSSVRLMRGGWTYLWVIAGVAVAAAGIGSRQAAADTLEWALVQAYQNNPSLNAQRAALRATDENVPQALSGYRPKLSITANGGTQYQKATSEFPVAGTIRRRFSSPSFAASQSPRFPLD